MSDPTREALEAIRTFARHDESCDFTTGLRGVIASAPCSCGFDAAEDLYDAATAALSTTPAPLDVDRIADDVRYVDGNGTSDYWRGFNDGIDKLAEAIAREYAKP